MRRKVNLEKICEMNKEAAAVLKVRNKIGRPHIEEDQPELLQRIIDIVTLGGAAHDRRRTEEIRSCKTLDELHKKLLTEGFQISRSATYLRIIPRNSSTLEGKRRVAPVRLCRAQNDDYKSHEDSRFCTATTRALQSLASLLGPNQVAFISQDDKCRVPLGLKAAQKQPPILMHVQHRVKLMDHDWIVAEKHELIPSVYGALEIKPQRMGDLDATSYSGPTYTAIRSGKHDSSTAASHAVDFERLLELPEFESTMKFQGTVKPVIIINSDGGPDENLR